MEIKYCDQRQERRRIINYTFKVSSEVSEIYSAIGDECMFYLFLRKILYLKLNKAPDTSVSQQLTTKYRRVLKECRAIWDSSYSFFVPNCLKFSLFYCGIVVNHLEGAA